MRSLLSQICLKKSDERGVSTTVEVLVFVPLAMMFLGFLLNGALHWIGMQYVQAVTNSAAQYAAAAIGDNPLGYIPGGGYNMKPSEYLNRKVSGYWLTPGTPPRLECGMVSKTDQANGIARCSVSYNTLVFPTDPLSKWAFGKQITTVAENLTETGSNPNVQ